jgi:hydrogenase maturation protein HypF
MSRGKAEKNLPKILGVGAHLKNTIAIGVGEQMFVSQHIGDLETPQACASFERAIASLQDLYDAQPQVVARDAHPDYRSTQFAATLHLPVISVQHHYAHVLACMAENQILGESALGVAWDGTGYGLDGTIWGGEFLRVCPSSWERVGHFRTFRLPGGDKAVKEPRRVALGLLYEVFGEAVFGERSILDELPHLRDAFTPSELKLLQQMFQRQLNVPLTSSAGRLFDGVAAIAGVRQTLSFEGQAAMGLEFALEGADLDEGYPVELHRDEAGSPVVFDWGPMVVQIVRDLGDRLPVGAISAKFHNTLVEAIAAVAQAVGEERIVLTGGCFQNAYLSDRAIRRLRATQLRPYWHQRIPPNDGGIALGQIVAASRAIASQSQYKQLQQRSMDLCV